MPQDCTRNAIDELTIRGMRGRLLQTGTTKDVQFGSVYECVHKESSIHRYFSLLSGGEWGQVIVTGHREEQTASIQTLHHVRDDHHDFMHIACVCVHVRTCVVGEV